MKTLLLPGMHIGIDLGLANVDFDDIRAIFVSEKWKKTAKRSFLQYFTVKTHTKIGEKSCLALFAYRCSLGACPCQVSSHSRDFLTRIKKNGQKSSFLQYFTVQTHTKIGEKSFFALFAFRCSLEDYPCQVLSHRCKF